MYEPSGSPRKAASPHSELGFRFSLSHGWEKHSRDEVHIPWAIAESLSPSPCTPHHTKAPSPLHEKPLIITPEDLMTQLLRWSSVQGVGIEGGVSCHRCVGLYLGQEISAQDTPTLLFFEGRERNG